MIDGEGEGSVQVEDTTGKENIEPPTKKTKTEPKNVDLETRLNDILSCNVCLALPCKAIFQVSSNRKAIKNYWKLWSFLSPVSRKNVASMELEWNDKSCIMYTSVVAKRE